MADSPRPLPALHPHIILPQRPPPFTTVRIREEAFSFVYSDEPKGGKDTAPKDIFRKMRELKNAVNLKTYLKEREEEQNRGAGFFISFWSSRYDKGIMR